MPGIILPGPGDYLPNGQLDPNWMSNRAKALQDVINPPNQNLQGSTANYADAAHQGGGSTTQYINGQWYNVSNRTGYKTAIQGVTVQPINGANYYVSPDGTVLGLYTPGKTPVTSYPLGGGGGGPTWYEQQQVTLDKQRIADAEAAQKFQEAQALEAKKIAESNAVESANQAFRDAQLKSTYGTINGMAYASPKGSPFVQQLPEPLLLKESYADNKQVDPWSMPAQTGGYTGQGFMNAQQPGLANQGDPNMQVPLTGPGSAIPLPQPIPSPILPHGGWSGAIDPRGAPAPAPSMARGGRVPVFQSPQANDSYSDAGIPGYAPGGQIPGTTGQPQLIMAHGGEQITPAPGTPLPTLLGSPGGAPFSNPTDPNDPNNPSPQGGGSINDAINNLISAAQALVTHPGFKGAPIPIPGQDEQDSSASGQPPVPGMAAGGMVNGYPRFPVVSPNSNAGEGDDTSIPGYAAGGKVPYYYDDGRSGASQSNPVGSVGGRGGANQLPPPFYTPQTNAYGQTGQATASNVIHAPTYNDISAGPGVLNHMPYSPVLTGLSGYGATMTRDGTPVVMSNWQRNNLMPSSISGPGGYDDYAMQVAGWNPADLAALGKSVTGNFGVDLSAPKNYSAIPIAPAPGGG